ncbi:MAG: glycosyltransferase family 39 protein, partial [Coriobacteriia bacterium]|nr:glycosyltransferase family 39 protein [Coriobacteriia bacterium]
MSILIVLFWCVLVLALLDSKLLVREAMLASVTAIGVALLAITEGLSAFGGLTSMWLVVTWLAAVTVAGALFRERVRAGLQRLRVETPTLARAVPPMPAVIVTAFASGTLIAGLIYPPYNWDSLTYHLPRIHFWLQNGSVAHFPTAEARQLFSSPLANYVVLHLQALSGGGDRLINLGQWVAYLVSAVAVSLIARRLGAAANGQWLAAIVAISVPMAALQAATTQNDLFTAAWCLIAVYAIVVIDRDREGHASAAPLAWYIWAAAAAGLALQSKPTALLALAPFGLWFIGTVVLRTGWRRGTSVLALMVVCVVAVNSAWYVRNAATLDGDFLGLQAPGNDHILTAARTPAGLAVNGLMNASMLLGTPSAWVNDRTRALVERTAAGLGVTELDSVMGEPLYGPYRVKREIWSHDVAPALLTVALFVLSAVVLLGKGSRPKALYLAYPAATIAGF